MILLGARHLAQHLGGVCRSDQRVVCWDGMAYIVTTCVNLKFNEMNRPHCLWESTRDLLVPTMITVVRIRNSLNQCWLRALQDDDGR